MPLQDTRDYQILFLSVFLMLGIGTKDWTLRPEMIGIAIATCLSVQWLAADVKYRLAKPDQTQAHEPTPTLDSLPSINTYALKGLGNDPSDFNPSLRSALITALGLSLLLRTDHWWTMVLASILAILSKFLIQIGGKHCFNPANFGIIAVLVLTHDAWVSPGQWGEVGWYGLLFAGAGGIVLQRVGRWDTTVAFLGTYALLSALRHLWLGWTWDVFTHGLMSGSLLLFALFMLTDPRSIPDARLSRLIWASCMALLTLILQTQFYLSSAIFWALFLLAPLTPLLDQRWIAQRFVWEGSSAAPKQ